MVSIWRRCGGRSRPANRPSAEALSGLAQAVLYAGARALPAERDAFDAVTALFRHPLGLPIPHTAIVPNKLKQAIGSIARALADDATMLAHINSGIERLALALVVKRREIASVIEEVVHRWDARTLSERLELVVGSDLQYIRMKYPHERHAGRRGRRRSHLYRIAPL